MGERQRQGGYVNINNLFDNNSYLSTILSAEGNISWVNVRHFYFSQHAQVQPTHICMKHKCSWVNKQILPPTSPSSLSLCSHFLLRTVYFLVIARHLRFWIPKELQGVSNSFGFHIDLGSFHFISAVSCVFSGMQESTKHLVTNHCVCHRAPPNFFGLLLSIAMCCRVVL